MLKKSNPKKEMEMLNLEQRSDQELQDWILHYLDEIMLIEKELERREK
jgi:selenophosphate synthetase-related protein